ncbi:PREDICTED: uncharacterized protein LOC109156286 [Ipomoea nil]|uniref:uncharacterized protein LOC109156286 n=1 Tax=Ipomoea nil TaxID=35883 RepID=UPI0009017A0C|nr:PREDICTED: uncharacterized protein LOC109156286 [Ipomoea nil]
MEKNKGYVWLTSLALRMSIKQASNAAASSERTISVPGVSPPTTTLSLSAAHHFVSVKLTSRNYLFLRTQLVSFLSGQGLLGFVDGTYPCPVAVLAVASSPDAAVVDSVVPDPSLACAAWLQQDQAVLSMLISSLSEEVMHHAVGRSNSRQGSESIADYLGRAQVIVEDLALAGRSVPLDDQNLYVFRGLRPEYRPLAATLATGDPVSLTEIADFLVAHEFIYADASAAGGLPGPAAMAVHRGGHNGGRNGQNGGRGRG